MRILGIDQGIAHLGYCILEDEELITYGCLTTTNKKSIQNRFYTIEDKLSDIIKEFSPEAICCEKLFFTPPRPGQRNKSASIVYTNMITGVIISLAGRFDLEFNMFVPGTVKKTICDNGRATKNEVIKKIGETYEIECPKSNKEHICDAISIAITFSRCKGE